MKKTIFLIMLLLCIGMVQASFTTQVAGTISSLSGASSLNGADITVTIHNADTGAQINDSKSDYSGSYVSGMTILSAEVTLTYATTYKYNLTYGSSEFVFTFTTPAEPSGGGLLPTGQTTSYRTGDDAYHSGVARNDFTRSEPVSGEGVVSDSLTGLMWQDGGSSGTWNQAIDYCNGLSWANEVDWRLPNYMEFASVLNLSSTTWNFWPEAFDSRPNNHYWTGTTLPSNTGSAYVVDMGDGIIDYVIKGISYSVRCVRDQ
jgi:hypothetical protein